MSGLHIIAAVRSPFSKLGTDLADFTADDLGRHACSALLTRTGIDPGEISEVIFGCVAQPADAANIARVIALRSGIPEHVPAATVQRNGASGLEAITTAHQRMCAGQGDLFLVGGTESMTHTPLLFPHEASIHFAKLNRAKSTGDKITAAAAFHTSDFRPRIGLQLGQSDPFSGMGMGDTAEKLAREFKITREAQDAFAADSHRKAFAALDQLNGEIAAVHTGGQAISRDNGIRGDSIQENLVALEPIFDRDTGSVTAGNSSPFTDGSVALLVGSEAAAKRLEIEPLGRLISYAYSGCDPARMGLGPVHAIARARNFSGLGPGDADLVEINEDFAAQVLAVLDTLKHPSRYAPDLPPSEIPMEKLNRRGGSIALGHPIAASGARLVLTALDQLHESKLQRALVTLCIGGGQGAALWLER